MFTPFCHFLCKRLFAVLADVTDAGRTIATEDECKDLADKIVVEATFLNVYLALGTIFCLCWFVFLVILVDGVLKFQTLVGYFGSCALVEITLLLFVILPTLAVYRLTKE